MNISNTKEVKDGTYELFHKNGQLHRRGNTNKDGKREGLFESFYENGQLEERGNFIDGKRDGTYELFHENGQLWVKGNINKDGEPDGLYERYYENGQLEYKRNYKDGKEVFPRKLTKINETLEILDCLDDLLIEGRIHMIDVNHEGRELVLDKTLYQRLEEVGREIDFFKMCVETFCQPYPCVPNTPKNTTSESQQNQGVEYPDLDVTKGNVL